MPHGRVDQARAMAHLRKLPRPKCSCGKTATTELVNGVNAPIGVYCGRCAPGALRRFRDGWTQ